MVGQIPGPYLSGMSGVLIVIDTEQYFQLCVKSDPTAQIGDALIFCYGHGLASVLNLTAGTIVLQVYNVVNSKQ